MEKLRVGKQRAVPLAVRSDHHSKILDPDHIVEAVVVRSLSPHAEMSNVRTQDGLEVVDECWPELLAGCLQCR